MDGFVGAIFEIGQEALTGMGGLLVSGVNALVEVFWVAGTEGQAGHLTIMGIALAIGAGVGVLFLLFNLIRSWLSKVKG